jgi:hypothetical protein
MTQKVEPYQPSFWELKAENMIVKRISDTEVFLIQVKGRDLGADFAHNHSRATYPSKDRLDERLQRFTLSTEEEYEIMLATYFQVNDPKRERFNQIRQMKYEQQNRRAS